MLRRLTKAAALFSTLLAVLPSFAYADVAASTFYLSETQTQFSLNIPNTTDSNDVYFYFTSPATSWVAVGFGSEMKDSLSFIMYLSKDGNNVTVSPRIATGHSEPSLAKNCTVESLPGTNVTDDMFVLNAVAHNCRVWPGGFMNEDNTAQPMIYAFGSGTWTQLQSDSLNAPLGRHIRYGKFSMDLRQATGEGGVPSASQALSGVTLEGGLTKDSDAAKIAHAVLGCLAIFFLWPINVLLVGFFKRLQIHIGVSILIMVFLIIAYALGISMSSEYNRSKNFNSAHQIAAFISIAPILLLSLLPIRPIAILSPWIPRLHTPLSTATLAFLIVTGGLGLRLASQLHQVIWAYSIVSAGIFFFIFFLAACIRRRGSAYARATGRRRLVEEDEQDLVLAAYHANLKMENESGNGSAASLNRPPHERNPSGGSVYGGGAMPGPHYMLNMHPGVPVHRW